MVFTDMQFNRADPDDKFLTNYEVVKREFAEASVQMPLIVFWNIRGDVSNQQGLPTHVREKNVVYLSGYIADLLQDFFGMLESGAVHCAEGQGTPFRSFPVVLRS
jgi:hypothetical protein